MARLRKIRSFLFSACGTLAYVGTALLVAIARSSRAEDPSQQVEIREPPQSSSRSYQIHETEKSLELSTPFGPREVLGDLGKDNPRYRVEIPISALKPTPKPESDATAQPGSANEKEIDQITKEAGLQKMGGDGTGNGDDPDDDDDDQRSPASLKKPTPPPVPTFDADFDDTDRLILEANHLYNLGKFYEASIYVDELVRKKPNYLRGWIMKGSLLYVQGHRDLAKQAWQQALALAPQSQEVKDLMLRYR